ncbi:DUF1844 domain-containing protein [Roseiconus lacunae]|uniref:DUF1844 domain-containing protein n=1 Tax=Roseiconus lacunae TaxID=2605694 RepID=A0ABT7PII5_9BACT|nr:DUF1844 domain-containing protein [Roseiconus lacunae]MCD0458417.1 DUF1844 domain-containing protein [Roseiconus lacunae]MDM4016305.1 DUF1844 domain-containing protein [Roseiconus lacunae]WRQ52092.1 DUF1844 domain-containing protein [Stieleria sp. HD01]
MSEESKDPKLVVDDDWKSQVEQEKNQPADDAVSEANDPTGALPPASLAMLISTFYSQAMIALGVMANPATDEKSTDLVMAKHFIDTLEMLQEKTKGNTDTEEDKMFDEVLHLLRMAYVGSKNAQ